MRNLLCTYGIILSFLFCGFGLMGQSPIEQLLQRHQEMIGHSPAVYDLTEFLKKRPELDQSLALKQQLICSITQQEIETAYYTLQPVQNLHIYDPNGELLELELVERQIWADDATMKTDKDPIGKTLDGVRHYWGKVKDKTGSLASLSISNNEIMIICSDKEHGNMVMAKMLDKPDYIVYYENDITKPQERNCGTDALSYIANVINGAPDTIRTEQCRKIGVYLDCDYKMFQDRNLNVNSVRTFITSLFNTVALLYFNDKMHIEISELFIWTTQDPYPKNTSFAYLNAFGQFRQNNFKGNLAQAVSTVPNNLGGVAWLNQMCSGYNPVGNSGPYSIANISNSFASLPTYSWSVEVMAHELGHGIASPHTHSCSWGPNKNQALDNCFAAEGGCMSGPQPQNGGTIMSYCHLNNTGINFANGFGEEPAALMRNRIQSVTCLSNLLQPIISRSVSGKLYEGDNVRLRARPNSPLYSYDWFQYDYKVRNAKDSFLNITNPGIYTAVVSSDCSEYSKPDTIVMQEFLVNLGCPIIPGEQQEIRFSNFFTINPSKSDTIEIPDSILATIPSNAKNILVKLEATIDPQGLTRTAQFRMQYYSPDTIGIINKTFNPNSAEPNASRETKTYTRTLGKFNPAGKWIFVISNPADNPGIDAEVKWAILITWKMPDVVSRCTIGLCDNTKRILDAGFSGTGVNYSWNTNARTKTIEISNPGTYAVTVTRNNKSSSHSITVINQNTQFTQQLAVCEGDSVQVGNHFYATEGEYTDTLRSTLQCDSILTTNISILKRAFSNDTMRVCYGDSITLMRLTQDTFFLDTLISYIGCDSIHTRHFLVNPELAAHINIQPMCEDVGAIVTVSPSGGTGSHAIIWNDQNTMPTRQGLQTGTYTIQISDSNMCSIFKEIEITNVDSVQVIGKSTDVSCFGKQDGKIEILILSGTAPFIVRWSHQDSTSINLGPGKYKVFVVDANGCKEELAYEIFEPQELTAIVEGQASSGMDGSAKCTVFGGTPPFTYSWSNGMMGEEITNLAPGMYIVTITDNNGCMVEKNVMIDVKVNTTSVENKRNLFVFPNPAKDKVYLFQDKSENINAIHIFSTDGKRYPTHYQVEDNLISIPISNLPNGHYIMQSISQKHINYFKLEIIN